jgi:predicted nucleic acid-binding protein
VYLVDTNVLSAASPGRRQRAAFLVDWMDSRSENLFLSAVTVAEISDGIAKVRRTGAVSRADNLRDWLETVLHLYGSRVLPFDSAAARLAGELMDKARAAGQSPGFADIAIAATAGSRNLTILTHNLRHFAPLGVAVIDPLDKLPA